MIFDNSEEDVAVTLAEHLDDRYIPFLGFSSTGHDGDDKSFVLYVGGEQGQTEGFRVSVTRLSD